jgi:hypothetical protein
MENEPPDIVDIEIAVQSMRSNKMPGIDSISIKLCKKAGKLLISMLHSLIKRIW